MSRLILPCKASSFSKTCLMGFVSSAPVITLFLILCVFVYFPLFLLNLALQSSWIFIDSFVLVEKWFLNVCTVCLNFFQLQGSFRVTGRSVKRVSRYRKIFCSEVCKSLWVTFFYFFSVTILSSELICKSSKLMALLTLFTSLFTRVSAGEIVWYRITHFL